MWFRRNKEAFQVQLHVNSPEGVIHSYTSFEGIKTLEEARQIARRLRQDNRWGNETRWPLVTIHNNLGEKFPEVLNNKE